MLTSSISKNAWLIVSWSFESWEDSVNNSWIFNRVGFVTVLPSSIKSFKEKSWKTFSSNPSISLKYPFSYKIARSITLSPILVQHVI